jgi:hypothetical protein
LPDQAGTVTAGGTADTVVVHADGSYTTLSPGQSATFSMGDLISTGIGGTARGAMNDGSVLNVGSNAELQVQPASSVSGRSWFEQIYGNFRAWTVRFFGGGGGDSAGAPVGLIVDGRSNWAPSDYDSWMG